MPSDLSRRIVAGYRSSFEHPSEKERAQYLKKHPKADPKHHTVKKPEGVATKPEVPGKVPTKPGVPVKPTGKPEEKGEVKKPGGGKAFLKSLSGKARSLFDKSSESVKKFIVDPAVRAKAIEAAKAEIMKAPGNYVKRLVKVAQHEIHEFKEAGQALGQVVKGKKLDDKQKKTVRKVAVHLGIAITAAALTSTGLMAGVVALGKGLSQKIAIKAAIEALDKVHTLNELTHIGHGLSHILEHAHTVLASEEQASKETLAPEEAFAILVMQSVFKQLDNLDDEILAAAMEAAA